MQNFQYDLFTEKNVLSAEESHQIRLEMRYLNTMTNNVRKGLFARLNEQSKLIMNLIKEIEEIKGKKKPLIFELVDSQSDLFRKTI